MNKPDWMKQLEDAELEQGECGDFDDADLPQPPEDRIQALRDFIARNRPIDNE